jgi:hypothetical protein
MAQPREAEIGAQPVEQRQRAGFVQSVGNIAVGDLVADMRELGRREPCAPVRAP